MIRIREEQPQDRDAIREIHVRAFGQSQEAEIVDTLRRSCNDLLSLVALKEDSIVGHILFSPVTVEANERTVLGMGLAPMAVMPEFQKKGVGSELVRTGVEKLRNRGCPFVIVLGHPEYYPRFGFEVASRCGIRCEWDVPDDAFMILVLDTLRMRGVSGVAKYRPEFRDEA